MRLAEIIEIVKGIFKVFQGTADQGYVPPKAASEDAPVAPQAATGAATARGDLLLSAHFGLFELTKTNNAALQGKNRILTDEQVSKLGEVANLMEKVREIVGAGINVHSGYRSPDLNAATVGSAKKSQHILCEACDWSPVGATTEAEMDAAFDKVLSAAKAGQIKFGELIVEKAMRGFSTSVWVHISIGLPYRDAARCGEALKMIEQDGKQVYTLVGKVPQ